MEEKIAQIALTKISGLGPILTRRLLQKLGSASAIFKEKADNLALIDGVGPSIVAAFKKKIDFAKAEATYKNSVDKNISVLFCTDKQFPNRLKVFEDAPVLIYREGNGNLDPALTVGIIGTRKPSEYGKQITEDLVNDLFKHQPTIVSGLAFGIDIYAEKTANALGLETISVLASGLDVIYPSQHLNFANQFKEKGSLVSEYEFGVKSDPRFFSNRNRIIAMLSDAVIVVESPEAGGSMITANLAFEYNKPVYAFPGNIRSQLSAGCHKLIRENKAQLITGVADLEIDMGWLASEPKKKKVWPHELEDLGLEPKDVLLLKLLIGGEHLHIDQISRDTQLPISEVGYRLLQLEFAGWVKALPGKKFTIQS